MGSRGAFIDVDMGDFTFKEGGQVYFSVDTLPSDKNVKILRKTKGSVNAPEYSHTPGRIYGIIQDEKLKYVAFYGENNKQKISLDLLHPHGKEKLQPHKHYDLNHKDNGIPLSDAEQELVNQIKKECKLL